MREMANGMADLRKRLEKVEGDQTVLEESHSQLAKDTSEYKDSTNSKIDDSMLLFHVLILISL